MARRALVAAVGCLAAAVPHIAAHGFVRYPPTFHDHDGSGVPSANASAPRVSVPGCTGRHAPGEIETNQGCAEQWYENNTFIPGEPTICPTGHEANCAFKTMLNCPRNGTAHDHANGGPPSTGGNGPRLDGRGYWLDADGSNTGCNGSPGLPPTEGVDTTRVHPWRAPGTAPITSPCGIDGGNPRGCSPDTGTTGCMPGGYGHGPDGRALMLRPGGQVTTWKRGSVVEAKWTIGANHNGGYSYRLAKKPTVDPMLLTEETFQQLPLNFSGDTQWAELFEGNIWAPAGTRKAFPAMTLDEGTFPKGSQWRRNPIPCCDYRSARGGYCHGTMFPPPAGQSPTGQQNPALLMGFGDLHMYSIVDELQLPHDLEPGDYVLGFRWDTEQFAQVWSSCSHIRIVA